MVHESPVKEKYASKFLSPDSQKLLLSCRKEPRYISKTPYKVLDAPELQDDYYLNLLDWSSSNILSVGLGTSVGCRFMLGLFMERMYFQSHTVV